MSRIFDGGSSPVRCAVALSGEPIIMSTKITQLVKVRSGLLDGGQSRTYDHPMSVLGTVIVGIVILIGVIGAVVQIWPSAPVVGGAILVWSWMTGTRSAWIIFAIVALVLILGTILKYVIPARGMNKAGIPQSTLVWGAVGGVVGWFVGLPLGLVLGMIAAIFLVEYLRSRDTARAWKATVQALKAFGWTIAIELIAALTSATAWGVGVALAATGN